MVAMGRFAAGDEDPARISAALTRVGAAELAGRPFDELSGGERQRVVVARALAQEAPVLLLDEPAAHLDVGHQVELYRLARALAREGRTVVMACHDLFLAPRFLDRAILLVDGHLTALGTPDKVLAPEILRATFGIGLRIDRAPGATVVVCPGGALHEEARPAA
jgi:iron complex transport system ATP-binding protein